MRSATNVSFRLLNARSFDGDNGAAGAMVPTSRRLTSSASATRADSRKLQKVFTSGCYNLPSTTPPLGRQYRREGTLHRQVAW